MGQKECNKSVTSRRAEPKCKNFFKKAGAARHLFFCYIGRAAKPARLEPKVPRRIASRIKAWYHIRIKILLTGGKEDEKETFINNSRSPGIGIGGGITANAQPKTMPDGEVFDAEFYAQTYPDVVAAIGTDENSLYRHYLDFGAKEGRLAAATQTENPPVTASVYAPGSIDLYQSGLAVQADSINQQLAERVPAEYGNAFVNMNSNSIEYAAYSGGAGSYTMQLLGRDGYWELLIMNRLVDTGDGYDAVADINCQVLQGMCNAICSDGGTLYSTIYQNWEGQENLIQGEWKDFGSFQLMFEIRGGRGYFSIK